MSLLIALLGERQSDRREFLRSAALGTLVAGGALAGMLPLPNKAEAQHLRPPGAIPERDFLAACIKCGQCVQVCPVVAIKLADIDEGFGVGVPYIDARGQACDFSCDAVQCILACPTGALSHELSAKEEVRMGFARLDRPDACLARQGLGFKGQARGGDFRGIHRYAAVDRWKPIPIADHPYDLPLCDLCVRECPIKDAIELAPMSGDPNDKRRTPVVKAACVGCGMCEMICPAAPTAIKIDARAGHGGGKAA